MRPLLILLLLLLPPRLARLRPSVLRPLIAVAITSAAPPLTAFVGPRALARPLLASLPGPLFPLAKLLLHEATPLGFDFLGDLAEPAIRAALPPFRVRLLAFRAEDALR